ncbi:MAG: diguanylate cyclase [Actinobacteria bacterium]|nr:diguanylate cyclase [Actinomycetota bacterium]
MIAFFSTLSLLASLVCIFIGGLVLLRNPRQPLNRIFCLLCLSIAYWAFIEFQIRISNDYQTADTLIAMRFIWPWPSVFALHLALVLTNQKKILDAKLIYFFGYAPAFLESTLYLIFHDIHWEPIKEFWGWTYQYPHVLLVQVEILYSGMLAIIAVYLCLRYARQLTEGIRKKQAEYITVGLAIPTAAAFITEILLPQVGIKVPEMTTIGFAFACGFIAYAIIRYELFVLTPTATAEEIVSTMPGGLFLVNPDGIIQSVNRAALELVGNPEKELVGKPLEKIFGREWVEEQIQTANGAGRSLTDLREVEGSITNSTGDAKSISAAVTGLKDTRGSYAGTIIVARDITERKLAEEAIRESEQKFRSVAQSAAEAIVCTDNEGIITFWNSGAEKVLGYRSQEAVGSHFRMIVPERHAVDCKKGFTRVASGGQPAILGKTVEVTAKRKNGDEFPIELSLSTWETAEGKYFTAIIHDISDRKKAEAEIYQKTALLEAQLNSTIDGILIVDEDGRKIIQNRRCLELWKIPEEIRISEDFQKQIDYVMGAVVDPERFIERVVSLYDRPDECSRDEVEFSDGTVLDRYSSPVVGSDGRHFGRIWIYRDITVQKQNEGRLLRQSEKLLAGNRDLHAFNEISSLISREIDLEPMLHKVLAKITELDVFSFERKGGVFLVDDSRLELVSSLGHSDEFMKLHEDLRKGQCLCGRVAVSGEVIVSDDCETDHRHEIRYPGMKPHGHVVVPLKVAEQTVGVLYLYTPAEEKIEERHVKLLESIGNLLGVAIANARLFEETKRLSLHDPLTGLANRNLMNLALTKSFAIARRTGRPISLIMLDLDHFKDYNDSYGHASGDRLLQDISLMMSSEIREVDLAARYGGEEFLLILTDTALDQAVEIAERIRISVDTKGFFSERTEKPTHITISLGVAAYDESINNQEILVARADTSLYRAKGNGRNRVEAWLQNVRQ